MSALPSPWTDRTDYEARRVDFFLFVLVSVPAIVIMVVASIILALSTRIALLGVINLAIVVLLGLMSFLYMRQLEPVYLREPKSYRLPIVIGVLATSVAVGYLLYLYSLGVLGRNLLPLGGVIFLVVSQAAFLFPVAIKLRNAHIRIASYRKGYTSKLSKLTRKQTDLLEAVHQIKDNEQGLWRIRGLQHTLAHITRELAISEIWDSELRLLVAEQSRNGILYLLLLGITFVGLLLVLPLA